MKRSAQAKWQGDLKGGSGTVSTASGTLATTPYSFRSRFEQGTGTTRKSYWLLRMQDASPWRSRRNWRKRV